MKYILHMTVVLFILVSSLTYGQELDARFSEANQAYADEDFQQAISLYSKILDTGIESGEVYFNLGNTYYKTNNLGKTILYYEKARKYIEGDPALEQNLKLAKLRIIDKIEPIPELFIVEWWSELIHVFTLDTLLWLSFSIFTVLIVLIIGQLIYTRQFFQKLIWVTSLIFVLILIIALGVIYEFETTEFGIILAEKVSVLSEPDLGGTEVFILHEGTKVRINRMVNSWLEITIADGKTGWLEQKTLEII